MKMGKSNGNNKLRDLSGKEIAVSLILVVGVGVLLLVGSGLLVDGSADPEKSAAWGLIVGTLYGGSITIMIFKRRLKK